MLSVPPALLALLLASLAGPAVAQDPEDGSLAGAVLDAAELALFERARDAESQGSYGQAIRAYGIVISREPGYAPAILGKARCLEASLRPEQALAVYRTVPMEADAAWAMARILAEMERYREAAAQYRLLRTLELGEYEPFLLEAEALVRVPSLDEAVDALEQYLVLAGEQRDDETSGALVVDLAGAYYDDERPEDAERWYERYREEWPDGEHLDEVEERLDRLTVEQAAGALFPVIAEPLPQRARPLLEQARKLVAAGEYSEAERGLERLQEKYASAPEVWAVLGELHVGRGAVAEAEIAYQYAVGLAPYEPTYRVRLAQLLREYYGGQQHEQAARELRMALSVRPTWYDLHYELGVVLQEMREFRNAGASFQAYLTADPRGRHVDDARVRLRALERRGALPPDLEQFRAQRPAGVPEEAFERYTVGLIYMGRGDRVKAREEFEAALELTPRWPELLKQLATLQALAHEPRQAEATLRRLLEVEPGNVTAIMTLADMLDRDAREEEAMGLYRQASELGEADAWLVLALSAAEAEQWQEARMLLAGFDERYAGALAVPEAEDLRARLSWRRQVAVGGASALGAVALLLPLGVVVRRVRRRLGATLRVLLEASPESYHDVAMVLSAMRHEVIKHNTTVLPSVADALEAGDRGPALDAAGRLFARDDAPGVVDRWWAYIDELEALGRRAGVRVNLRHLDPDLAPMCAAFMELAELEAPMVRGRAGAAGRLRAVSEAINGAGYLALGRLIREVCVLEVTEARVLECWEQVRQEPAYVERALPELEVRGLKAGEGEGGYPVRIFLRDFEDILVNVLRNSLGAVLEAPPDEAAPRLGVTLEAEEDWVTGLESVAIRVRDNSPRPLTDAMIRGRYIERGFGITVDLINRHSGSIKVEDASEPGWSKAVVVRLPRAEAEEIE